MKKKLSFALVACSCLIAGTISNLVAADVTGTWKSEFDSQIGHQDYTFTFKQDGGKLTGKANSMAGDRKREAELKEGKVDGDSISFFELLNIQEREIRITYTGKLSANGNEIKFTRQVGDFGNTEIVAKREEAGAPAQPGGSGPRRGGGRGGFGGPIELRPDDKPAFPDPPAGFNVRRDNVPHGEVSVVEYDSKTLGTRRQMRVYTPPGYSSDRKYPVLYLLHGIGANNRQWLEGCRAANVIDNLLADGKLEAMLMVFPNCDANINSTNTTASARPGEGGRRGGFEGYGAPFENDLLKENGVPHVWHVDSHAHDDAEWSSNLYLFAQHLFK